MSSRTDYFAIFGEQRRPWLEPEALKERFHRLTAEHHPDVNPASDFPVIIAAYNTLSDPKARVRHLLELEFPGEAAEARAVPADLQDLFMKIAGIQAGFGRLVNKLESAGSPLAVALLAQEKAGIQGQLALLSETLEAKHTEQMEALRGFDRQWPEHKETLGVALAAICQRLSFLQKWSGQLRENRLRLELL